MPQDFFERLADTGELIIMDIPSVGGKRMVSLARVDDPEPRHFQFKMHPDACGLCHQDPADGYATIGDIRYCHGDDDTGYEGHAQQTCYEKAQHGDVGLLINQIAPFTETEPKQ